MKRLRRMNRVNEVKSRRIKEDLDDELVFEFQDLVSEAEDSIDIVIKGLERAKYICSQDEEFEFEYENLIRAIDLLDKAADVLYATF